MTLEDRRAWSMFLGDLKALCDRHHVGLLGSAYKRLPSSSPTRLGSLKVWTDGADAVTFTQPTEPGGEVEVGAITWDNPDAAMGAPEPQTGFGAVPLFVREAGIDGQG